MYGLQPIACALANRGQRCVWQVIGTKATFLREVVTEAVCFLDVRGMLFASRVDKNRDGAISGGSDGLLDG